MSSRTSTKNNRRGDQPDAGLLPIPELVIGSSEERAIDAASRAAEFLRTTAVRPASSCATCTHPKRIEIDAALHRFVDRRAQKITSLSLAAFVERFLKPEFGYKHSYKAAERHVRGCLGLEIPR